jgi:hypothetical protein
MDCYPTHIRVQLRVTIGTSLPSQASSLIYLSNSLSQTDPLQFLKQGFPVVLIRRSQFP